MENAGRAANDLGDKTSKMLRSAGKTASRLGEDTQANLESLGEAASEYAEEGWKRAEGIGRTLTKQVTGRPFVTLLAAGGVGFLLALLFRRR